MAYATSTYLALAALAVAAGGAGMQYESDRKNASMQGDAQEQARRNALKQEKAGDEATNRANQRQANPMAALDRAQQAGKGGVGGTMLTGPMGVQNLPLGRKTLLGE